MGTVTAVADTTPGNHRTCRERCLRTCPFKLAVATDRTAIAMLTAASPERIGRRKPPSLGGKRPSERKEKRSIRKATCRDSPAASLWKGASRPFFACHLINDKKTRYSYNCTTRRGVWSRLYEWGVICQMRRPFSGHATCPARIGNGAGARRSSAVMTGQRHLVSEPRGRGRTAGQHLTHWRSVRQSHAPGFPSSRRLL
jgi:hypothetical protein